MNGLGSKHRVAGRNKSTINYVRERKRRRKRSSNRNKAYMGSYKVREDAYDKHSPYK